MSARESQGLWHHDQLPGRRSERHRLAVTKRAGGPLAPPVHSRPGSCTGLLRGLKPRLQAHQPLPWRSWPYCHDARISRRAANVVAFQLLSCRILRPNFMSGRPAAKPRSDVLRWGSTPGLGGLGGGHRDDPDRPRWTGIRRRFLPSSTDEGTKSSPSGLLLPTCPACQSRGTK